MNRGTAAGLVRETFSQWSEDKAPRLGAALAYYAVFSIPPLVLLVIAAVGIFYKGDVTGAIQQQLAALVGRDAAETMMQMRQQQNTSGGLLPGLFGIALLLFGASGVFGQLQDAMNTIWEVKPKSDRGIMGIVKDRFLSFTMVMGVAFLLLISLVLSAAVSALAGFISGGEALGHVLELGASFIVVMLLFAMIFKILPDVKIAWSDVWVGAAATAVLFVIGKFLIGLYLGKASVTSSYGAAGPLIVVIIWIYYSAQILFLGAEFTQVYANKYGSRVVPAETAEPLTAEKRAQEGIAPAVTQRETAPATLQVQPRPPASYGVAAMTAAIAGFLVGRKFSGPLQGEK